jgi:pimeloyl-CoA synthetase
MSDLRVAKCLSNEDYSSIFERYYQWAKRLVEKVAVKEDVVEKVASIMDKHDPSREEAVVLKVMSDLRVAKCLSNEDYSSIFERYYQWAKRLVEKVAVKEDVVEKVASIMDTHLPSLKETGVLKGIVEILGLTCVVLCCVCRFVFIYVYAQ